jgi:hypothetical protein
MSTSDSSACKCSLQTRKINRCICLWFVSAPTEYTAQRQRTMCAVQMDCTVARQEGLAAMAGMLLLSQEK